MKKITYLLVAMFIAFSANAQILTEEFTEVNEETGFPTGWTSIDNDGDGLEWYHLNEETDQLLGYDGNPGFMTSASWLGGTALNPDNLIITPVLNNATKVTYHVNAQDAAWPQETYALMASSTGTALDDFSVVFEETLTAKAQGAWYQRVQELPAGTKYVAWRHYKSTDWFRINLDGVSIEGGENSINELQAQGISVIAGKGMITINSEEAVNAQIINVAGQLVNAVSLSKSTTVEVPAGVYVVRVGNAVQKVLVK